ncbi:hypothetical protein Bca4012_049519 [Brassica carinata]
MLVVLILLDDSALGKRENIVEKYRTLVKCDLEILEKIEMENTGEQTYIYICGGRLMSKLVNIVCNASDGLKTRLQTPSNSSSVSSFKSQSMSYGKSATRVHNATSRPSSALISDIKINLRAKLDTLS